MQFGQLKRRAFITYLGGAGSMAAQGVCAAAGADAAGWRTDGVCRKRPVRTVFSSPHFGRGCIISVGQRAATSGSTLAGRRSMRNRCSDIRERTRRTAARPHSLARHTHDGGAAATNTQPSRSFSCGFPIQSVVALSRAWRGLAATQPVSRLSWARWAVSGWSC